MKSLILTLLFLSFSMVQAVDLVRGGKAVSAIVIPEKATRSARFAAAELQYHVKKITGAELPIVTKLPAGINNGIYIGETPESVKAGYRYDTFKEQEYLVEIKGNSIFLTGHENPEDTGKFDYADYKTFPHQWRPMGCTHAVYDFLEKLGVRWYLMTDIGIVYDPSENLRISDFRIRRVPSMETRFSNYHTRFPADLHADQVNPGTKLLDLREVTLWHIRRRSGGKHYIINHSLGSFRNRFSKTHPEWYAKTDSNRRDWDDQLCFTHPEVIAQITKDARDFFDGKVKGNVVMGHATPDYISDAFTIVPMDNGRYCQCQRCNDLRKTFPVPTRGIGCFSSSANSDYFFSLVNAVAKEIKKTHPGKYIATLAYASNAYPPSFKLEDNVIVMMCLHSRHSWAKDLQANDDAIMEAWVKEYPKMKKYVWQYWCFPTLAGTRNKMYSFPGFIGNQVPGIIEKYYKNNIKGFFWEIAVASGSIRMPLQDQLEIYLFTALAWNKDQSGKALTDEFFRRYYGPAEKFMKEFYLEVEKAYSNPANYPNVKGGSTAVIYHNPSWSHLATIDRMDKLGKLMISAKKAAVSEPYKSRIALFEKGVWQQIQKGKASGPDVPLQQESIPRVKVRVPGNPASINWNDAVRLKFYAGLNAKPLKRSLFVAAVHDGEYLYLRYYDGCDTAKLVKTTSACWLNDEWESTFAKQKGIPYRHMSVDCNGDTDSVNNTDTGMRKSKFPANIKVNIRKGYWEVLMAVKLSDIVEGGIKPGEMLHCNFIRACNGKPIASWNPTYSGFHAPGQLGEFYLEK